MSGTIEGYASTTSVFPGEEVAFHVRIVPQGVPGEFHRRVNVPFRIEIYRKGKDEVLFHSGVATAGPHALPSDANAMGGCRWPAACKLTIPKEWPSGVYLARLTLTGFPEATTDVMFVVKAAKGARSNTLYVLPVTTYHAYEGWHSGSLYDPPVNQVSLDRPNPVGLVHFYYWNFPLIVWLERNGFKVDFGTSVDLHSNPAFLSDYRLLLSVGHDEYWSWEMRDHTEAFIARGGNVAFLSGNVCWWQIRFADNNRTIVCYKDELDQHGVPLDPISDQFPDPQRRTHKWVDVGRRENLMTGVSFQHGAGWWDPDDATGIPTPRPAVGYRVRRAQHWVFKDTGLSDGNEFGADDMIVGYETDATPFQERNGIPEVIDGSDTPRGFLILATADLRNWSTGGQSGCATMGIYKNKGTVFTAATTDWSSGLLGPRLFVATRDNRLCWREPVGHDVGWIDTGHANNVVAMAATNGKLFAATRDNKLWWREPVVRPNPVRVPIPVELNWVEIGHANNVVAMAAINGKLFAATRDNKLWWRDPVGQNVNWMEIGHANNVVAMAATNGKLFAATRDSKLWWRDPVGQNVNWREIGHANSVVAMTAYTNGNAVMQITKNILRRLG